MLCNKCSQKATVRCCSTQLYCEVHFGQHFISKPNHKPEQLVFKLSPIDQSILKIELQTRISTLKNLRYKIISDTNSIIINLESLQSKFITEISSNIKNYEEILSNQEFSSLIEVEKILETEMIVYGINPEDLMNKIKDLFPRKLFDFEIDKYKKDSLIMKNFLKTHNGGFNCLAVSSDGKLLVTGSIDATVRVWDFFERKQIACYEEHKSDITCLVISKNSNFTVSGSIDKTLILWDMRCHKLKKVFRGHTKRVNCVALSNDEDLMISGSSDYEISIWNVKSFEFLRSIKNHSPVFCFLFISNDHFAIGNSNYLEYVSLSSCKRIKSILAHNSKIKSIVKTKNNQLIITCSNDSTVKIWELNSLKSIGTLSGHISGINSICVTKNDSHIISCSNDLKIILWSIDSLSKINEYIYHDLMITDVKCFEELIFSVSNDGRIGILKLSSNKFKGYITSKPFRAGFIDQKINILAYGSLKTVEVCGISDSEIVLECHTDIVSGVCLSSNMQRLVSSSRGPSKNLIVWDLQQKRVISYLEGHKNSVCCVDISFDDNNAISGDTDSRVLYWDLVNMKQICEFKGHSDIVISVKFTKSKKFAASGSFDMNVIVWDIKNQSQYAVLYGHQNYIYKVSITSDDKYIVSGELSDGIKVWSIEEKKLIFQFKTLAESKSWLANNKEKRNEFARFLL